MALLIKSVHILGSNRPADERVDVLVQGEQVSAIGDFPNKKADEVIDGQGAYISPGFIDIDTTSDHYLTLFSDPGQEDFLRQGVTTIIGGQCGASLAPILSGNLDSIRGWGDTSAINVNWHSIGELFGLMKTRALGVNFGTMVGHSTIKKPLTRGQSRDLNLDEIAAVSRILRNSLEDGAFGLSTGLGSSYGKGTSYKELRVLGDLLKEARGIYSTHLRRGGEELPLSIQETKKFFEETGASTLITHFTPVKGNESAYEAALAEINQIPAGADFHFSLPPFAVSTVPLTSFLPAWAQVGGMDAAAKVIADPHQTEHLLTELPSISGKDLSVAQAPRNDFLVGKTLQELMQTFSLPTSKKALLRLMAATKMRAVVHYKNLNIALVKEALKSPHALVASHAPSFGEKKNFLKSDRSTSTFPQFLRLVEKEKLLSLDEAVKRITSVPARKLGLKGRGEIKEGNIADLAVWKNGEVKCTIVGGKLAFKNGEITGTKNGKVLKHV
jgi:N-acyl-D-aspartate/D-glutamate deacylase